MARPRTPKARAVITGHAEKQKAKFSRRHEPLVRDPIGDPPDWLPEPAQAAWRDIAPRLPWLNRSHRGIVGITCILAGKLATGDASISAMNLLRQCLGQLGATPTDFARVGYAPDDVDDVDDEFFN